MTISAQKQQNARDRILDTAMRLFYQDGIRATGIDKIIGESGVAKMSFYRNFPSKADLVTAFLLRRHDFWMSWFTATVEERLVSSNVGIEVIADVLRIWFKQDDFRGCAFINTVAESGSSESDQCRIARDHKAELEKYVERLAARLGLKRPKEIATSAMIIIEGTIVRVQMTEDPDLAVTCKQLLKKLGNPIRETRASKTSLPNGSGR